MTKRWMPAIDTLLFGIEIVILVRLFTVHPAEEKGFDGALRVAGQTFLGLGVSFIALIFASYTMKRLSLQKWFAWFSVATTAAWGLLFLLASVSV